MNCIFPRFLASKAKLDEEGAARERLQRIPTDLKEATERLNTKIIGEGTGPAFVKHYCLDYTGAEHLLVLLFHFYL